MTQSIYQQLHQQTKGSPLSDRFKFEHKTKLPRDMLACDFDLVLIAKYPVPGIVAVYDVKSQSDGITYTETVAYDQLIKFGIRVFVFIDVGGCCYNIGEYKQSDISYQPPRATIECVIKSANYEEIESFERSLRDEYEKKFTVSPTKKCPRREEP